MVRTVFVLEERPLFAEFKTLRSGRHVDVWVYKAPMPIAARLPRVVLEALYVHDQPADERPRYALGNAVDPKQVGGAVVGHAQNFVIEFDIVHHELVLHVHRNVRCVVWKMEDNPTGIMVQGSRIQDMCLLHGQREKGNRFDEMDGRPRRRG